MAQLSKVRPMSRLRCDLCRDSSQGVSEGIRTPDRRDHNTPKRFHRVASPPQSPAKQAVSRSAAQVDWRPVVWAFRTLFAPLTLGTWRSSDASRSHLDRSSCSLPPAARHTRTNTNALRASSSSATGSRSRASAARASTTAPQPAPSARQGAASSPATSRSGTSVVSSRPASRAAVDRSPEIG